MSAIAEDLSEETQVSHKAISTDTVMAHARNKIESVQANDLAELLDFVNKDFLPTFLSLRHQYPWYGLTQQGMISPIIRIDMAPPSVRETSGEILRTSITKVLDQIMYVNQPIPIAHTIYECETNPEGWHAIRAALFTSYQYRHAQYVYDGILTKVSKLFGELGAKGFCNMSSFVESDEEFCNELGLSYTTDPRADGLYWKRVDHVSESPLSNAEYQCYCKRSLTDIFGDSRKDYLLDLHLAKDLTQYLDSLHTDFPWQAGFCIKPTHGTRSRDVLICPPQPTNSEIENIFQKIHTLNISEGLDDYVIMPYIPQKKVRIDDTEYKMILRMYLIWDAGTRQYEYLTGITTAIPKENGEVVNGSRDDALFWLVEIE